MAIINAVDGIVWEADADSLQFSFVSNKAEELLGYPTRLWLEEPDFWRNHLHPDDRDNVMADCSAAVAALRSHVLEYRMVAADGREVWLRDSVSVSRDGKRSNILRGIMMDITEWKRAESLLQRGLI